MRFGRIPVAAAAGAISAHTLRLAGGAVLKKGRVLGPDDLAGLHAAGYESLVAAQLDDGDVAEDVAAARLGAAIAGRGLRCGPASTGRCNLYAEQAGLLRVEAPGIDRLNAIDEAVTLATVAPLLPVREGELVATVKIIPFAVPALILERCLASAQQLPGGLVELAAFAPRRVGLILTRHAGAAEGVLDRAASAQRMRIERLGGAVVSELRCPHDEAAVAAALTRLLTAGCTLVLLLGASAIVDRRDVIPTAIERAGGTVEYFGMPVDPGNLLLLARADAVPIVGVPGCARSLRRSGFDWVLERLYAGIAVTPRDLAGLGVGGLLREVPVRPQPRAADSTLAPRVAAVVLAAGLSQRMGDANKLLVPIDGQPLVARVVDTLLGTAVRPIVVVTGHQDEQVRAALADRDVRFCHNPDYAAGMSTSLRTGVLALGDAVDGALICLGDMPCVRPAHLEALLGAFDPADGRAVVVPTYQGRRGNPVLWAAQFFPELQSLTGDVGARALLQRHAEVVCTVPVADDGVIVDVDTSEALRALQT